MSDRLAYQFVDTNVWSTPTTLLRASSASAP
jgi:hypothetical protein